MTGFNTNAVGDSFGLLSPKATSFDFSRSPSSAGSRLSDDFDVTSPTTTEFPKDPFARRNDAIEIEISSPRATEFHMTALHPAVEDEDEFGLTSPKKFEFPSTVFQSNPVSHLQSVEADLRRPSFQAILPPSGLPQPEAVNGLASLNSIAQAPPSITLPILSMEHVAEQSDLPDRVDSLSSSPDSQSTELEEPQTPGLPELSQAFNHKFPELPLLSTPQRQPGIRTRFSSPNLRDQRRLHKIQTEMESQLPYRLPRVPQAQDDIDALLSPRAEEFTRNPFHFDIAADEGTSPASSTETIKEDKNRIWSNALPVTPQKVAEDPRSPVQTGSSPIVRNIWDVL